MTIKHSVIEMACSMEQFREALDAVGHAVGKQFPSVIKDTAKFKACHGDVMAVIEKHYGDYAQPATLAFCSIMLSAMTEMFFQQLDPSTPEANDTLKHILSDFKQPGQE